MSTTLNGHIEITPGVSGGRPRIAGHRIRVQDIAIWHERDRKSATEIVAQFPQLTLADVHAALTYYFDHRSEIDSQIEADDRFVEAFRAAHGPGPLARKLANGSDGGDAVSS
jgi:uncharacterized protein (DUF433 family)